MKLTRYIPILLILICTISISTIHHLTEEDNPYTTTISYLQSESNTLWQQDYTWKSVNYTSKTYTPATSYSASTHQHPHSTIFVPSLHMTNDALTNSFGGGFYHIPINNRWTNHSTSELSLTNTYSHPSSSQHATTQQPLALASPTYHATPLQQTSMRQAPSIAVASSSVPQMATTTYDPDYVVGSISNRAQASDNPFIDGELPDNPEEPMPLGDIPLVFMIILSVFYAYFRLHKQVVA